MFVQAFIRTATHFALPITATRRYLPDTRRKLPDRHRPRKHEETGRSEGCHCSLRRSLTSPRVSTRCETRVPAPVPTMDGRVSLQFHRTKGDLHRVVAPETD